MEEFGLGDPLHLWDNNINNSHNHYIPWVSACLLKFFYSHIFHVKKWKVKEGKETAQGHSAGKWPN